MPKHDEVVLACIVTEVSFAAAMFNRVTGLQCHERDLHHLIFSTRLARFASRETGTH